MRWRRTSSEVPKVDSEDHSTRGRPVAEQIRAVDCREAAAVVESVSRLEVVIIPLAIAAADSFGTPLPVKECCKGLGQCLAVGNTATDKL